MQGLMKVAMLAAPVAFLIFFYTVQRQETQDAEMTLYERQFDRDFAEARTPFAKSEEEKKKLTDRAAKAEAEAEDAEKAKKERDKKLDEFEKNMSATIEQHSAELEKHNPAPTPLTSTPDASR